MATLCYTCNEYYSGWSCPICNAKKELEEKLEEQHRETERLLRKQKEDREIGRMSEEMDRERMRWREDAEKEREREEERELDRMVEMSREEARRDREREIERKITDAVEEQEKIKRETLEEQQRIAANAWKYEAESKRNEAIRLIKGKMPELAIKLLSDAISKDPSDMSSHLWLCVAYSKSGEFDKALMYCTSWMKLFAMDVNEIKNPRNYVDMLEIISKLNNPPKLIDLFLNILNNSATSLNPYYTEDLRSLYHWSVNSDQLPLAKTIAKSASRAFEDKNVGLKACIALIDTNYQGIDARDKVTKAMKDGGLLDTVIDRIRVIVESNIDSVNKFCFMMKSFEACDLLKKQCPEDIFEKGFDTIDFNKVFGSMNSLKDLPNYDKNIYNVLQDRSVQAFEDRYEKVISGLNAGEKISIVVGYIELSKILGRKSVDKVIDFSFEAIEFNKIFGHMISLKDLPNYDKCNFKLLQEKFVQAFEDRYEKVISGLNAGEKISVVADYIKLCKVLGRKSIDKVINFGFETLSHNGRNSVFNAFAELKKKGLYDETTIALLREKLFRKYEEWEPNILEEFRASTTGEITRKPDGSRKPALYGWGAGILTVFFGFSLSKIIGKIIYSITHSKSATILIFPITIICVAYLVGKLIKKITHNSLRNNALNDNAWQKYNKEKDALMALAQ